MSRSSHTRKVHRHACAVDLEGKAPRVHPLPPHVEPLLEIALECPTVCPEGLADYITSKVLAVPVPSPKAAVAWLHFACWQVPKVRSACFWRCGTRVPWAHAA